MPFVRHLHDRFIKELNGLHDSPEGTWWRALVENRSVYLAIRKNAINAYAGGAAIARIEWAARRGISLKVHHKYLVFPGPRENSYVELLRGPVDLGATIVNNPTAFADHLDAVIGAATALVGGERADENLIACRLRCVVDMEVVFATDGDEIDETKPSRRQRGGRIDLIVLCKNRLVAVEVKLRGNPELRARVGVPPPVSSQLFDYHNWMAADPANTAAQYNRVLDYYDRLKGVFFEFRRRGPDDRIELGSVDSIPRLLITRFRAPDRQALNGIAKGVVNGCQQLNLDGFARSRIDLVGKSRNVTCDHFCKGRRRRKARDRGKLVGDPQTPRRGRASVMSR